MREIKFRGHLGYGQHYFDYASPVNEDWEQFWSLVDLETVGQWTGLLDRNGTEIYEGDIVDSLDDHATDGTAGAWSYFICEYINGAFRITGEDGPPLGDWDMSRLEVVGNIWENPKLAVQ